MLHAHNNNAMELHKNSFQLIIIFFVHFYNNDDFLLLKMFKALAHVMDNFIPRFFLTIALSPGSTEEKGENIIEQFIFISTIIIFE